MAEGGGVGSHNYASQGVDGKTQVEIMWENFWVRYPDGNTENLKNVINPAAAVFILKNEREKVKKCLARCHIGLDMEETHNCITLACSGRDPVEDVETFIIWLRGAVTGVDIFSLDLPVTSPLVPLITQTFSSFQNVEIRQKVGCGTLYLIGNKEKLEEAMGLVSKMMKSHSDVDSDVDMDQSLQGMTNIQIVKVGDHLMACLLEELKFEDEMKRHHADCTVLIDKKDLSATFVDTTFTKERCSSEINLFLGKIQQRNIPVNEGFNALLCKSNVREAIDEEIKRNGFTRIYWYIPSGNYGASVNIYALSKSEVENVEKIIRKSYSKIYISDEFIQDESFIGTYRRLEPFLVQIKIASGAFVLGHTTALQEIECEYNTLRQKMQYTPYNVTLGEPDFSHVQKLNFQNYLSKKIPRAQFRSNNFDKSISIFGTVKDVEDFKIHLSNFLQSINRELINLPERSISMLCSSSSGRIKMLLEKGNILCHWLPSSHSKTLLQVFGLGKEMTQKAVVFLKDCIVHFTYPVSDTTSEAFSDPDVKGIFRKYKGELEIEGLHSSSSVQVFVLKDHEVEVKKCISDAIEKLNAAPQTKEEYIEERKLSFLCKFACPFLQELQNRNEVNVKVTENGVTLSGQRANVQIVLKKLKEKIKAIKTECRNVEKMKAEALKRDKQMLSKLEGENKCMLSIECGSPVQVCTWMSSRNYGSRYHKPQRIVLVHGNAMKVHSDVLVCPVNVNADHAVGICQNIAYEGGPQIEDDFRQISELKKSSGRFWSKWKPGTIHMSYSTGKLRCQCLLYVCVPDLDNTSMLSDLRTVIDNVVHEADKLQYKTIAIPIELLEESPKVKAVDLLRNITKYLTDRIVHMTYLEEAYLCLQNPEQIGKAEELLNTELSSDKFLRFKIRLPIVKDGESKISIGVHLGAISKYPADVIVNTIGIDLNLSIGGVSKGILKEAGEKIQEECHVYSSKKADYGKVIHTSAGIIKSCKAIFHGSLPFWIPSGQFSLKVLMSFVYDCLNLASERHFQSIAFPSLGTGKLEYPRREVATAMWDAVEMFSQNNPSSTVQRVTFVLFHSDIEVIQHFHTEEICRKNLYKRQPFEDRRLFAEILDSWVKAPSMMVHLQIVREPYPCFDCSRAIVKLQYASDFQVSNAKVQGKTSVSTKVNDKDGTSETEAYIPYLTEASFQDAVRDTLTLCLGIQSTMVDIHVLLRNGHHSLTLTKQSILIREEVEKMKDKIKFLRLLRIILPSDQQSYAVTTSELLKEKQKPFFSFTDKSESVWKLQHPVEEKGSIFITGEDHGVARVLEAVNTYKMPKSSHPETIQDQKSNEPKSPQPQTIPDPRSSSPKSSHPQNNQDPRINDSRSAHPQTVPKINVHPKKEWCLQEMEPMESVIYKMPLHFSRQLNEAIEKREKNTEILKRDDNDVYVCNLQSMMCNMAKSSHITMRIIQKEPSMQFEKDFETIVEDEVQDNETQLYPGVTQNTTKATGIGASFTIDSLDKERSHSQNSKTLDKMERKDDTEEEKEVPCSITDVRILQYRCQKHKWWSLKAAEMNFKDGRLHITYHGKRSDRKSLQRKIKQLLLEIGSTCKEEIAVDNTELSVIEEIIKENSSTYPNMECFTSDNFFILCSDNYGEVLRAKHVVMVKLGKIQTSKVNRRNRCFEIGPAASEDISPKTPAEYTNVQGALGHLNRSSDDCSEFTTDQGLIVKVYTESILNLSVDAIVNAANENLMHGAGIAHVIANAAGYEFSKESREYVQQHGKIPVGTSVSTSAGNLKYDFVIHTVGPMWNSYNNASDCLDNLEKAVMSAIEEAERRNLKSVAIPAISSGIFAVPKLKCVEQYFKAVEEYCKTNGRTSSLKEIHFVDKDEEMVKLIQEQFATYNWDFSSPGNSSHVSNAQERGNLSGSLRSSAKSEDLKYSEKTAESSPIVMTDERAQLGVSDYDEYHYKNLKVFLYKADICATKVDMVVCPQDPEFREKGRIAKAICTSYAELHSEDDLKKLRGTKGIYGSVKSLKVKSEACHWNYVAHAVPPRYLKDTAKNYSYVDVLKTTVNNVLREMRKLECKSVGMPVLGAAEFGAETPPPILADCFSTEIQLFGDLVFGANTYNIHILYYDDDQYKAFEGEFSKIFKKIKKPLAQSEDVKMRDVMDVQTQEHSENLSLCMDTPTKPKTDCIKQYFKGFKATCPNCGMVFGRLTGDQPDGEISIFRKSYLHLPGYETYGTIIVTYSFPDGVQGADHPNPGKPYKGVSRSGNLPDNTEGKLVAKLLNVAFSRRLIFTMGRSRTSDQDGVLTWNDIHHKTRIHGGPDRLGYPDETYLERVLDELSVKGVTKESADDPEEYAEYTRVFGKW